MSKLTAAQIFGLADELVLIGAGFNPAAAASVHGLIVVGQQLTDMLTAIQANDPTLWASVTADYDSALAGFASSVARGQASALGQDK